MIPYVLLALGAVILGASVFGIVKIWPRGMAWAREQRTPSPPASFILMGLGGSVGGLMIMAAIVILSSAV